MASRLHLLPANVLQCPFAQNIGIAFTGFRKVYKFVGDCLLDAVVAVSSPQSDANNFQGQSKDAAGLWAPLRYGVIGIRLHRKCSAAAS